MATSISTTSTCVRRHSRLWRDELENLRRIDELKKILGSGATVQKTNSLVCTMEERLTSEQNDALKSLGAKCRTDENGCTIISLPKRVSNATLMDVRKIVLVCNVSIFLCLIVSAISWISAKWFF